MLSKASRLVLFSLFAVHLSAQDLKEFEKRVTEFSLANGMRFLVLERHEAPVVAFNAFVNAGSVDDPCGQERLGPHVRAHDRQRDHNSRDEKLARRAESARTRGQVYDRLDEERRKGPRTDQSRVKQLEAEVHELSRRRTGSSIKTHIPGSSRRRAGTDLMRARQKTTRPISTAFRRIRLSYGSSSRRSGSPARSFASFTKSGMWFAKSGGCGWSQAPKANSSSSCRQLRSWHIRTVYRLPVGPATSKLYERRTPRHSSRILWPANVTIAVVGDVTAAQIRKFADKYFGPLPSRPLPPPVTAVEPKQEGERRAALESASQPYLIIGYKRPEQTHKDDPVFDVIADILSSGRTGWLYMDLVRDKSISLGVEAVPSFPGGKYPNLFILFDVPAAGHTVEENEKELYANVERLKQEKVDDATLQRVKTKIRAGLFGNWTATPDSPRNCPCMKSCMEIGA